MFWCTKKPCPGAVTPPEKLWSHLHYAIGEPHQNRYHFTGGEPLTARDISHHAVTAALIGDGWTITHDPYRITYGGSERYADLDAEHPHLDAVLAAERGALTIAVEITTFTGLSVLTDFQQAIGQYLLYRSWMRQTDPQRWLYLAVDVDAATSVFSQELFQMVADDAHLRLIVIDLDAERIREWKRFPTADTS